MDNNIEVIKIYPGISQSMIKAVFHVPGLKAVVIESYGSGNVPSDLWLLDMISDAVNRGIILVNVSQCLTGSVNLGQYQTSLCLQESGVNCGRDITTEAALAKLMFLLGQNYSTEEIKIRLNYSLRGEMSVI